MDLFVAEERHRLLLKKGIVPISILQESGKERERERERDREREREQFQLKICSFSYEGGVFPVLFFE